MPNSTMTLLIGLTLLVVLAVIFWPEQGLLSRLRRFRRLNTRVLTEDALKEIFNLELRGERPTLQGIAGALQIHPNKAAELLEDMARSGLLEWQGNCLQLTPNGSRAALHVIRAHRLWERYLAEETGYSESDWHDQAERWEHTLTPKDADALAQQLGYPTHDPHGDPIPTALGEIQTHGGRPLPEMKPNRVFRIVHVEDEPEAVYAQILAEGLYPGTKVRLIEVSAQRVRFWADGDEHVLAPIVAANLSVQAVANGLEGEFERMDTLDQLKEGETARVLKISRRVRGPERRRMMDMGILPGTSIRVELNGPVGDPKAYRVRGAMIALRAEQARQISIQKEVTQAWATERPVLPREI